MLLRNKSNRPITLTDKDFAQVEVKPEQVVEVEDQEGKGYLANYGDILEKVETGLTEQQKEDTMLTLEERVTNIETALKKAKIELPEIIKPKKVSTVEATDGITPTLEEDNLAMFSDEDKIAWLRENGVKQVSRTWKTPKLDDKIIEILTERKAEAEADNAQGDNAVADDQVAQ